MFDEEIIIAPHINKNIPDGTYLAELTKVETKEINTKFGVRRTTKLFFKILTPPFDGATISKRFFWNNYNGEHTVGEKSALGRALKEIAGKPKFITKENIGKRVYIKVLNTTKDGITYSNIDAIYAIPIPPGQPQTPTINPQPQTTNTVHQSNQTSSNSGFDIDDLEI